MDVMSAGSGQPRDGRDARDHYGVAVDMDGVSQTHRFDESVGMTATFPIGRLML